MSKAQVKSFVIELNKTEGDIVRFIRWAKSNPENEIKRSYFLCGYARRARIEKLSTNRKSDISILLLGSWHVALLVRWDR